MPSQEYQNKLLTLPIIIVVFIVLTIVIAEFDPLNLYSSPTEMSVIDEPKETRLPLSEKWSKEEKTLESTFGITRGEALAILDYEEGRSPFKPTVTIVQVYEAALKKISIHEGCSQKEITNAIEYTIKRLDELNSQCSRVQILDLIIVGVDSGINITFTETLAALITLEQAK